MGNYAKHFTDLVVYQKARAAANGIFEATKSFPKEEAYSLTDQIRRSSSKRNGAQIAEAWGKRKYERHFISKLTDADSEQLETQHWLRVAVDCNYLTEKQGKKLAVQFIEIGRMLHSVINKSRLFCQPPAADEIREEPAEYDLFLN